MKIQTAVLTALMSLSLLLVGSRAVKADEVFAYAYAGLYKEVDFPGTGNIGIADFQTVGIEKFDPALGELTSVEVTISLVSSGEGSAETTNAVPGLWGFHAIGSVLVYGSQLPELWLASAGATATEQFTGNVNGSVSVPLYLASGSDETTVTATQYLENVIGTGSWDVELVLETVQDTNQNDWRLHMWTDVEVQITVRYIYTPY